MQEIGPGCQERLQFVIFSLAKGVGEAPRGRRAGLGHGLIDVIRSDIGQILGRLVTRGSLRAASVGSLYACLREQ